jgi:hypothetical protein
MAGNKLPIINSLWIGRALSRRIGKTKIDFTSPNDSVRGKRTKNGRRSIRRRRGLPRTFTAGSRRTQTQPVNRRTTAGELTIVAKNGCRVLASRRYRGEVWCPSVKA